MNQKAEGVSFSHSLAFFFFSFLFFYSCSYYAKLILQWSSGADLNWLEGTLQVFPTSHSVKSVWKLGSVMAEELHHRNQQRLGIRPLSLSC